MAVDSRKTLLITDLDPTVFGKITIGNKCYVSIPTMSGSGFNSLFRYSIRDLGDVSNDVIPVENNILAFKNGKWVPSVIDSTFNQNLNISLNNLTDVNIDTGLSTNDVLTWDGVSQKWKSKPISINQQINNVNSYTPERIKFIATSKGQLSGVFVVSTSNEIYQSGSATFSIFNHFSTTTDKLILCPFSEDDGPTDGTGWKKVIYNTRNCYALTNGGQLWVKGYNDFGQLGIGTIKVPVGNNKTEVFRKIDNPTIGGVDLVFEDIDITWTNPTYNGADNNNEKWKNVVVAAICRNRLQENVAGADRYLYMWGDTNIAESSSSQNVPTRITAFDLLKPIKVSLGMIGATHYAVLCENGTVYTAANNSFLEVSFTDATIKSRFGNPLGRSSANGQPLLSSFNLVSYSVTGPTPIIKDVYAGCGTYYQNTNIASAPIAPYTMLIDTNNKLYYAGRNNTGQAGIGTKTTISTSTSASGQGAFVVCSNITTNGQLRVKNFGINDGAFHFAHIEYDTEKLVTLGSNIGNQLGTQGAAGMVTSAYSIVNMPGNYSNEKIKKVVTGSYTNSTSNDNLSGFTVILTNNGLVFTCGNCPKGQSGNGRNNPVLLGIVPLPEPISDITQVCGDQDSAIFAVGNSGKAYVWGANNSGQTGAMSPSYGDIKYPIDLPVPQ